MAWQQSVDLKGFNELMKQFTDIADTPNSKEMEEELNKIGRGLKTKIENKIMQVGAYNTGRLYRSVRAQKFKKKIKNAPATFVAIDRSKSKGAPHAWLVEFGSYGKRTTKSGENRGVMPAKPYFRNTVDQNRSNTESEIKRVTENIIKKEADKSR